MRDIRQTAKYAKYLRINGWKIEDINGTYCFIRKVPLIGSVIKVQRPESLDIKKIQKLAKKYRAFQITIEPKNEMDADYLKNMGFRPVRNPYLPTKTLHLDLTKTQSELFGLLKKDAKHALLKTEKLETKEVKDTEEFRRFWKGAVGWKRYIPSTSRLKILKKVFAKNALFLATKNGSAGAIFLLSDKIAYYWQAFSSKQGREALAQYKVVWEGILWAKARGAKIFDFEGVYDIRFPNKSWKGFSHFKKSFGGHEVKYPGAFIKNRLF